MFLSIVSSISSYLTGWWLLGTITLLLFIKWYKKPSNFPPGPRGIPILGVLPFAGKYPERAIRSWGLKKHGPVMSARMGFEDVVFLNSYYSIYQGFVKNSATLSGRPDIGMLQEIAQHKGIIMVDHNNYHRVMRQFTSTTLKQFGFGKSELEEVCNDEVDKLILRLRDKVGLPIDLTTDLSLVTGNMVFNLMCGRRCDVNDPTFRRCIWLVHKSFANTEDSFYFSMLTMFYSLRFLPPFRGARERWLLYQSELMGHLKEEIEEHKDNFDPNNIRDFIDAFLLEQQKEMKANGEIVQFPDDELKVIARDIFGGGLETTVTMVRWAITCLLHYPQFQDLIAIEISDAIGTTGRASLSLKNQMPITFAFLHEVFRFRPVSPLGIPHRATENTKMYGYTIPKGTTVISNIWAAHMDPTIWEKPFEFNPYRHIDEEGRFVNSEKMIAFSMGPRFCIGEKLGRMEVFAIFVRILQNFEIRSADEKPPPIDNGTNMIEFAPYSFDVLLTERNA